MRISSEMRRIGKILVLVFLLLLFGYYIYRHIADFRQIAIVNPIWLLVLIVLFLVNYLFIGLQMDYLIRPLGVKFRRSETFMLSITTAFYNLIMPAKGGMIIRAGYLKKQHGLPYTKFISSLAGTYTITFFISSFIGLISMGLIYNIYDKFNWIISTIFAILFISTILIILLPPRVRKTKYWILNQAFAAMNGWHTVSKNKAAIIACIFATFAGLAITSGSIIVAYHVFGIEINILQAIFLASIGNLTLLIQISPGNLGVTESISVFSATILGIPPLQSLPVALLRRGVQIIALGILGPIFSYILIKKPRLAKK